MEKKYSKLLDLNEFNRTIHWRRDIATDQKNHAKKLLSLTQKIHSCPICKGPKQKLFVEVYEYPFFECKDCGHLYCGTIPSNDELKKLYSSEEGNSVESSQGKIYIDSDLFEKRLNKIALPKAKFATDLIDGKGSWIDLGAGVGDLVIASNNLGWESIGFESDRDEVLFGLSKGANLKNEYLHFNSESPILKSAKIVSMINVLEHISDPVETVLNISKSIQKGAYFLFEVPRFPSISSLTNRCFPELAARNIYSPDHLHLFSDESAKIMMEKANLEIISTWFFGQDAFELVGNVLCNGNFENHKLIDETYKIINEFQKIIDQNNLSDTMLVLSRKK